jgi:hypothetical protein
MKPTTEILCVDVEAAPTLRTDPCVAALCARAREQAAELDDHERNGCQTCRAARAEREVTALNLQLATLDLQFAEIWLAFGDEARAVIHDRLGGSATPANAIRLLIAEGGKHPAFGPKGRAVSLPSLVSEAEERGRQEARAKCVEEIRAEAGKHVYKTGNAAKDARHGHLHDMADALMKDGPRG